MHRSVFVLGLWLPLISLQAGPAQEATSYRRHFECEDMTAEGGGCSVRSHETSSGGRVMQCSLRDEQQAKSHRLIATLERNLPPGRYLVEIAGLVLGENQGEPLKVELRLGEAATLCSLPRTTRTSCLATVEAAGPFRTIAIALRTPHPRVWFDRVFLTNELGDLYYDRVLKTRTISFEKITHDLAEPRVPGPDRPEPANWLVNGSFEAGAPTHDWCTQYQCHYVIRPEYVVAGEAAHGSRFLRVPLYRHRDDASLGTELRLMHRLLPLTPAATYHFRGMFRADAPAELDVWVETSYGEPVTLHRRRVSLDVQWRAVSFSFATAPDPPGCFLHLRASSAQAARLSIDALALSREPQDAFRPVAPVEVGVTWSEPGKVFHLGKPVGFQLIAANYAKEGEPALINLRCRVVDYFDQRTITEAIRDWTLPPGSRLERRLQLPLERTGVFRLLLCGEALTGGGVVEFPQQEYAFSVLPEPPRQMKKTFGAYLSLVPDAVEIGSRAGIRRTVTLSSGNGLLEDWSKIEPEPGRFVWWDERVELARRHDLDIIANLQIKSPGDIPAWARRRGGDPDVLVSNHAAWSRSAWRNFVFELVSHYQGDIRDWLIVDEPYSAYSPRQYVELLKVTHEAAKRADPECRVLAHGGYYDEWLPAMVEAGGLPYFDGISDYARTREQGERLRQFAARHDKFVLTVEYGPHRSLYRTIEEPDNPRDRRSPLAYMKNTEQLASLAAAAMCWSGAGGFNRYDARFPGGDFAKLDRFKSMFEYDGALKPPAVAYAVMSQLLDGYRGVEEMTIGDDPRFQVFRLADERRFALACRMQGCPAGERGSIPPCETDDGYVREAEMRLPVGVEVRDILGNPIRVDAQPVRFSTAITYVTGLNPLLEPTLAALEKLQTKPLVRIEPQTVIDPNTGQFLLEVRLTNLSDESLSGVAELEPALLQRRFWSGPTDLAMSKPGESAIVRFGLNAYRGEAQHPKSGTFLMVLNGVVFRQPIENVLERER